MSGLELNELKLQKFIGIIIILIIVVALLFGNARSWLNANEGAVAGVLSFLLVLLYFGQYRLVSRQIELENRPHVDIRSYDEDGRKLIVWLSNLGHGPATDLEIETEIDFDETEDISPAEARSRLRKLGEKGDEKTSVGNALKPGEQRVRFVGEPKIAIEQQDGVQR